MKKPLALLPMLLLAGLGSAAAQPADPGGDAGDAPLGGAPAPTEPPPVAPDATATGAASTDAAATTPAEAPAPTPGDAPLGAPPPDEAGAAGEEAAVEEAAVEPAAVEEVAVEEAADEAVDEPAEAAAPGGAESRFPTVGGHVGVAMSMIGWGNQRGRMMQTTVVGDSSTHFLFPFGITVRKSKRLAIDFELVLSTPALVGQKTGLTVAPGILYDWGPFATGVRASIDIGTTSNYGVVPLINRGFALGKGTSWFLEAALPIVVNAETRAVSMDAIVHTGLSF